MSRIAPALDMLIGIEDPDDLMVEIMDLLTEGGAPQAGNFYLFVYNPKTPGIRYDQNPLVAVTSVFSWGFVGVNFHWGESRQYTFNEVVGGIYQVTADEIKDLQALPFGKFRLNS